ncbi:hypothetical protein SprV_0401621800 [Sparganum proliferum]
MLIYMPPYRSCVESAIVGEEKLVDGSCGYTRLKVHPPTIEKLAVHPMAKSGDHAGGNAMTAEASLAFRQESLLQMAVGEIEENASEDFSEDAERRDSSVVVPELVVPFFLLEIDDCDVYKILRE